MNHILKLQLIEESAPTGRGRTKPIGEVLDEIEIEVKDQREGMEIMEELAATLEDDFGFEISSDVESN